MDNQYDISVPFFTLNGIKTFARLIDVYDGDTVTCIFSIFGENYFKFNIRLNGIDTAEMKNDDDILKERAFEARHHILKYLCEEDYLLDIRCSRHEIQNFLKNNNVVIWLECFDFDKYGRVLGNIYKNKEGISISDVLIESKLAYRYNGGKKLKNLKN